MLERIEQVLDEKVRPALRTHDGDIKVVRVEDGVLYFRMLGQCSNCPSAVVTAEAMSCGRTPWSCCGGVTPEKRENRHKVLWGLQPTL